MGGSQAKKGKASFSKERLIWKKNWLKLMSYVSVAV